LNNSKNIATFILLVIVFVMVIRFFIVSSSSLQVLAMKIAAGEIGVKESPPYSNRGKEVESYLSSVGLGGGHAWCMAFVYWCVDEAAKAKGVTNPLYRTGGVLRQSRERSYLSSQTPKVGSIFIMDYGNGFGHTGFVERIEGNTLHTIEGNTDSAGSRTGGMVMRQKRQRNQIKEFINLG
jgi:surface antigen